MWIDLPAGMQSNIDLFQPHECNYYNVGSMIYECHHCQALGFNSENRSTKIGIQHYGILCCNQGKIIIDSIPTPPHDMLRLWIENTEEANFFREHIRAINAQLNFGSLQVTNKTGQGCDSASFKVCGVLSRRIGSLMAQDGSQEPKCIQTYFYDSNFQDITRAQTVTSGDKGSVASQQRKYQKYLIIFAKLRTLMIDTCNNRYTNAFKTIKEHYVNAMFTSRYRSN